VLAKGYGHCQRTTPCSRTRQTPQSGHRGVQRFPGVGDVLESAALQKTWDCVVLNTRIISPVRAGLPAPEKLLFLLLALCTVIWPLYAVAHDVSEIGRQRMATGNTLDIIWTGAEHMITGYDHMLFLLGVMFFLTRFIEIIKFVTAFTVGHIITLIFATYAGITANHYLIDAVIALTVAYKGFENLDGFRRWFGVQAPNLLFMVFVFGLIHGFGLAAQLQTLTLRDDPDLLGKILLFNVGVEVGQIMALMVMAVAIRAWQQVQAWPHISRVINSGLILAGFVLLAWQLAGFYQERQLVTTGASQLELEVFAEGEFLLGQARYANGRPLPEAEVLVTGLADETVTSLVTDDDGWFAFVGTMDRAYRFSVSDTQGVAAEAELMLGQFELDYHDHDGHIEIWMIVAVLLLLSVIPARVISRRGRANKAR